MLPDCAKWSMTYFILHYLEDIIYYLLIFLFVKMYNLTIQ